MEGAQESLVVEVPVTELKGAASKAKLKPTATVQPKAGPKGEEAEVPPKVEQPKVELKPMTKAQP